MRGFTLNHATTSRDLGLRFRAPVEIPSARRTVEDIEISGRAGTLTRVGGWDNTTLTLPLAVDLTRVPDAYQQAAIAISGASTIELSGQPGVFRMIKHASVSPLVRELSSWGFFDAELVCDPFSYLASGLKATTLTTSSTLTNPGLLASAPTITVYGTGTLTFSINGTAFRVASPTGQVTIDSTRLVTHVVGKIQVDALTGSFPTLIPGANKVSLGTGISKLEIVGNWRNP